MSRLEPTLELERLVRRIEVIKGGDRRRWTVDETARIVAEMPGPGAVVSVIARTGWRHSCCSPGGVKLGSQLSLARTSYRGLRSR